MTQERKVHDVFLSHNSSDKQVVKEVGQWLEDEAKLRVWLADWNLVPGDPWQEELENAIAASACCAVFVGASGIGAWQKEEIRSALADRISLGELRVVPVLLPGAKRPQRESELPRFLRRLTWVKFRDDWREDEALHRLVCGIRGVEPGRLQFEFVDVCPYRGLEAFREEDSRFFFGRESVVDRLLDYLGAHHFLAVVGPSGSGKSSVIHAGLMPKLRDQKALICSFTPRERPLEELAFALRRLFLELGGLAPSAEELIMRLRRSAQALHLISREILEAAGARRLFLFVDQFEELFTQALCEGERHRFLRSLLESVETRSRVSIVLGMRSDFLGRCVVDPDLNAFVTDHIFQMTPMSREELHRAIVAPAQLSGLVIGEALAAILLEDLIGASGELPLLEHALLELYGQRDGSRLTLETYQKIGRIHGALIQRAEEEFAKLDAAKQELLRRIFVFRLIEPGEGTADTRRRANKEDLLMAGDDPQVVDDLLEQWTHARLFTTHRDDLRGLETVEVAHETLIRRWQRVQSWVGEHREEVRSLAELHQLALEWEREGCDSDYLLRGVRLGRAQKFAGSHGSEMTELAKEYIGESSRKRALRKMYLYTAVGSLLFIVVLGLYALWLWQQERRLGDEAQEALFVSELIVELFSVRNPGRDGGRITAKSLLDGAVPYIEQAIELDDLPEQQNELLGSQVSVNLPDLLEVFGWAYYGLGIYDEAERWLTEALAHRRQKEQAPDQSLVINLLRLSAARSARERPQEARSLRDEALEILRRKETDNQRMVSLLNELGLLLLDRGDLDTTAAIFEASVAMKRRLHGNSDVSLSTTLTNLGKIYETLGEYQKAETAYLESLRIKEEIYGEDAKELAVLQNNLAVLLTDLGLLEPERQQKLWSEAEELFGKSLDARLKSNPPDHPRIARIYKNRALLLTYRGELRKAEVQLDQALEIFRAHYGEDDPAVAETLRNRAVMLVAASRPEEAEGDARQAAEILRNAFQVKDWRTADAESILGECLLALNRRQEARELLENSLAIIEAEKGERARATWEARRRLQAMRAAESSAARD